MRTLAVGVVLIAAFLTLGALVSGTPPALDVAVADTLGSGWQHTPGAIASGVSAVLGPVLPYVFSLVLIGLMVLHLRRGAQPTAWLLARCLVLMWLCRTLSVFKLVYRRERPRAYPDYAFPSGHVVSVACVAFTAIVVCLWLAPSLVRWVVAVAVAAVVVIMVARVVLDVHWCTDVVGAVLAVTGVGLVAGVALRVLPVRPGVASTG